MKILVARDDCRSIKNIFGPSRILCDIRNEIIEIRILN